MQITIAVPEELGRRVQQLPNPDQFVVEVLAKALQVRLAERQRLTTEPSRWARLAQRIAEDPVHLDGYSRELQRDAREFRDGFAFRHDQE